MRPLPALAALVALFVLAPAAEAGAPIAKLPACEHAYLFPFSNSTPKADFREGMLCLINAVRKSQHLPALKRDARLESVAQAQSDKFAKTGSASLARRLPTSASG